MQRKIKKYFLEFEKTLPYFTKQIGSGKTLAELVVEKTDFKEGVFYTFLPQDIEIKKIYNFKEGIIPPIPYGEKFYHIKNYGLFHPQQVITMDRDFSEFIFLYLKKNTNHSCIVDNFILTPEESSLDNVEMIPYADEVYYILSQDNSEEEVYKTIRTCNHLWHFLCLLTSFQINPSSIAFDKEVFNRICNQITFIIGGAYDGDGYIFWERTSNF